MSVALEQSNSLAVLAAQIKSEHEAVSGALKESVRHAVSAGELLIEAKQQLKHGDWLTWLQDGIVAEGNIDFSERAWLGTQTRPEQKVENNACVQTS
jgi:Protein of unknown function (DUF3102)